jgi:hypothetical protein
LKRRRMSSSEKGTMAYGRSKASMDSSLLIPTMPMSKASANREKWGSTRSFPTVFGTWMPDHPDGSQKFFFGTGSRTGLH